MPDRRDIVINTGPLLALTAALGDLVMSAVRFRYGGALLLLCGALAASAVGENLAPKHLRVAVLADQEAAQLPLIALLEVQLSQDNQVELVERERLALVLKEQSLSVLSGAASCADRLKIGQLLHADLLCILTREAQGKALGVVVSETRQGLRLRVSQTTITTAPEADARAVQAEVAKALRKHAESVKLICAVPPLINQDLAHSHDLLQASYARLLQEMLLDIPGVIVVETEEARAIGQELALGGEDITRRLPVFLLGEFRLDTGNVQRPPYVKLALRRGEQELGARQGDNLPPEAVPAFLRNATVELLALVNTQVAAPPDSKLEAQELASRARCFHSIGNYREAAVLAEASLLLHDEDAENHRLAMNSYGHCVQAIVPPTGTSFDFGELAREHMERYLLLTDVTDFNDTRYINLTNDISESLYVQTPVQQPDLKTRCLIYQKHCRESIERVLRAKFQEWKMSDRLLQLMLDKWLWLLIVDPEAITLADNLNMRLHMVPFVIAPTVRSPNYFLEKVAGSFLSQPQMREPIYTEFLNTMETQYPHPGVTAAVNGQREYVKKMEEWARQRRENANKPKPTEPTPKPAGPPEVIFTPIVWTCEGKPLSSQDFRLEGILPCGKDIDLVYGCRPLQGGRAYLMRRPGVLEPVVAEEAGDGRSYVQAAFDGRYAWVALTGKKSTLVAVEVATGAVTPVTAANGLPAFTFTNIALGGLSPGKLCLAGAFGEFRQVRAYVAVVTLELGKPPRVQVIHEATKQLDLAQDLSPQRLDPQLNFLPRFMAITRSAEGKPRVIVARSLPDGWGRSTSLIVDPETGKATVMLPGVESHIPARDVQILDNAAFWVTRDGVRRLALDSTGNDPMCPVPEEGKIVFADGRVHLAGDSWWVADNLGKPFRKLSGEVPSDKGRSYLTSVYHSNLFGIVIQNGSWREYTVKFMGEPR